MRGFPFRFHTLSLPDTNKKQFGTAGEDYASAISLDA
jgi:hypothetical protein